MQRREALRAVAASLAALALPAPARAAAGPPPNARAEGETRARIVDADPSDYLEKLRTLRPGDTLRLAEGEYAGSNGTPGLPIYGLHGTPDAPITITGPEDARKAIVLGVAGHNAVRIANASHVVVRDLEIDGRDLGGDGVNGQGNSHHITLENLTIRGVGDDQGTVGISTNRAPAWHWTIRGCTIVGAGTGMYLGNSDGTSPFVAGVIERNLVRDTLGYNIQIKHQRRWPSGVALPEQPTATIIRHNVLSKRANAARGPMARPSLLVGDQPGSGPGRDNRFEIYGNFMFQNPGESLFQGEGNIAFYANVLVNEGGSGVTVQRHNGYVRDVRVFGNTIVASGHGISIVPGETVHEQAVVGNAVFAGATILAPSQHANVVGAAAEAVSYLVQPVTDAGPLDLSPRGNALRGPRLDLRELDRFTDWNRDFDGRMRDWRVRGAYSGGAARWHLGMTIKR